MEPRTESSMDRSIVGTRIRRRRRELGISQTELARRVGISASYMNLIEWNKRQIAGSLLRKIAESLDLNLTELDGASENRLFDALNEIAHLPSLAPLDIEENQTGEMIGRFPGWARGIAALARSEQEATSLAQTLSDRLSNDPFLGETVHRMLTRIAAIRSAAEILTEYKDTTDEERERFYTIINEESRVLSDVGEALAAYLDKVDEPNRTLTPLDEVEALFDVNANRFADIEAAASAFSQSLTDPHPVSRQTRARALVDENLMPVIAATIGHHAQIIETATARVRAQRALIDYAVGAILMPLPGFERQAELLKFDIEALADAFSVDIDAVCQRLTALPPSRDTPRFGYYRANAAGALIKQVGLDGLSIPRYAPACPLWVLYRAQQSPEAVIRQRAIFPSGARFVFVARARNTGPTGFGKPRQYVTDMVAMPENDARLTVYAPDPTALVEEVGPSCRLCPRPNCAHRVEDPLAD